LLKTAEGSPNLIKYLALLTGLLVVVAFGLRPAIRCAGSALATTGSVKATAHRELAAAAPAPVQLNPAEPDEIDPDRQRTQEIFEQVTTHLKKEPTQSSRLLQSWIHSD
jgi:flagellar M-ring protein FliF